MLMGLVEKADSVLIQNVSRVLFGHQKIGNTRFNPEYIKHISDTVQKVPIQRSHSIQLRSTSVNEVQVEEYTVRPFNAVECIRHYDILSWMKS